MQFENQKRIFFCIKTYSLDACDVYELSRSTLSSFRCLMVEKGESVTNDLFLFSQKCTVCY
jgi:hypothetical protein